ncbi:MAG: DUF362 domain-containing protein [Deltaproteobacteria bacterium]|nr:DUF362 domain-containing protein [Deltaproteobacteria bacterium]
MALGVLLFGRDAFAGKTVKITMKEDIKSTVYRAVNGHPSENLSKVIDLMGGIETFIGPDDVVVIKPNVQWWNQGVPNLSALNAFVDLIMNRRGGFHGEVVLAENCHRGASPWESLHSGWAPVFSRNSDLDQIYNFNDLGGHLKKKYHDNFSICHLIDVDAGNPRVFSPEDGTGYVYCDGNGGVPLISLDNGARGDDFREVIMTYPIFKTDKGTLVDFKNGIWEKGRYTDQPLKFINFAALNHHSTYCGATSSIKNYLGISDISGGSDPHKNGKLTEKYYNFHSFPFNKWTPGPEPGMIGAEIGVFLNTIRNADLNITTAEWIGLASRTEAPVARTRTVLASTDPVALDFHSTKYLLYPNSKVPVHNPDDIQRPMNQSYDFKTKGFQGDDALVVIGEKTWGRDVKMLMKYFVLRFW